MIAVHFITQNDHVEIISTPLASGANADRTEKGPYSLHLVSSSAADAVVQWFLKLGLGSNDRNNDGCTPLYMAVMSDDLGSEWIKILPVVRSLFDGGTNVDAKTNIGHTALRTICLQKMEHESFQNFRSLGRGACLCLS